MATLNFDAMSVAPSTGGTSSFFPLGDYPFTVTKVETKQVKDKQGEGFLEVTLTVTDGQFKGGTLIDRFNLWNSSAKAVEIAYSQLSSLCRVTGRLKLVNDSDLVGGTGIGTFGPQVRDGVVSDKYSDVKQYKDIHGRVNAMGEPVAAPQPVPAATQAPAQGVQSPWTAAPATQQPQQPQMPFGQQQQPVSTPPANGWQAGPAAVATVAPASPFGAPAGTATAPPWAVPQQ